MGANCCGSTNQNPAQNKNNYPIYQNYPKNNTTNIYNKKNTKEPNIVNKADNKKSNNIIQTRNNTNNEGHIIDTSQDRSNIDRHASLGSSVNEENSFAVENSSNVQGMENLTSQNTSQSKLNLYKKNRGTAAINNNGNIYPLNLVKTLDAHDEKIVCLIELSNGKIATGSYDCTIKIWNLDNFACEKIINEEGNVLCIAEFEDNMILSGTTEKSIQLWDISGTNPQNIYSFQGHKLWISAITKLNDKFFASSSNDANIFIWDFHLRKCVNKFPAHKDCILSMIKLNDDRLCTCSADLTIKIWNWETGRCEITLTGHTLWVKCLCQLNTGILLSGSDDKTIKIWNDEVSTNTLSEHQKSVRCLCQLSPDFFASGSFDKTIKIWNINSLECVQTLKGHSDHVTGLIYHRRGYLISCSNDHTLKFWKK